MAKIVINEISQNYTYNIGDTSYATVAIPITASWGEAFAPLSAFNDAVVAYDTTSTDIVDKFENVPWKHFPATQEGVEQFVATYRGPASNFKSAKDYSYQMAMTYLTAGYDVLVCRVTAATYAQSNLVSIGSGGAGGSLVFKAKYAGTFGNTLRVTLRSIPYAGTAYNYWNAIVYIVDPNTGTLSAVENHVFFFEVIHETETIPYYEDIKSDFITIVTANEGGSGTTGTITDSLTLALTTCVFDGTNGSIAAVDIIPVDTAAASDAAKCAMGTINKYQTTTTTGSGNDAVTVTTDHYTYGATYYANLRYSMSDILAGGTGFQLATGYTNPAPEGNRPEYVGAMYNMSDASSGYTVTDPEIANVYRNNEFNYTAAFIAYTMLTDKLNYSPNRVASPWDDQNFDTLDFNRTAWTGRIPVVSPIHRKIMEVAYYGRCATGMIDIPRSCTRANVYNATGSTSTEGYAQLLSHDTLASSATDINTFLYNTHCALFAPWAQYRLVGMTKQTATPPSMLGMLIQRAMILNQPIQYEWALPTNRSQNLKIGALDYKTPKHILDKWQSLEGVGVNVIADIPALGVNLWGNSTLFEVPPATYQALANLSTRYLVNAVEDLAYRCGIAITFQYNNQQAYNKFYAGVTPLLDTMRNVGAIEDYYVKMSADIDAAGMVRANTVLGKIYLVINGVINDVIVDLIALPPGTDLAPFTE